MKIKIMVLMIVLLSFFVSGITIEDEFSAEEYDNISIGCFTIDNGRCNDDTECYLTVKYPDNSVFIDDKNMSRHNEIFYYNFSSPNMTGIYYHYIYCCSDTENRCAYDVFNYDINAGMPILKCPNTTKNIILYICILIIIAIGLIFGINYNIGLITFISSFALIFLSVGLYNCYWIIGVISTAIGFIILIRLAYNALYN